MEEEQVAIDFLKPNVEELVAQRKWSELRDVLARVPAPEIADLLLSLDMPCRALLFRVLPRQLAAEAFAELEPEHQNTVLKDLTVEETRRLLADMSPDERTQLLEELPGQATQRLLNLLSPEDLREARQLLGYPEESVGRLMTPDYVAVRAQWTVGQALEHIRAMGRDSETINVVYVVNRAWKLLDALDLRRFILASPGETVDGIMDRSFISVSAFADREETVRLIQRYNLSALPVVDSGGVLVGIVTVDDVLDVAQEEATEDFHKAAAVAPLELGYRGTSIWSLFKKRIGWLVALVVVNLGSSGVIAAYEETLAAYITLVFFIPLLIASGGNTGAQSATLMIRALATADVRPNQWILVLLKELYVGAFLGATMGLAAWGLGLVRGGPEVGFAVGLAMVLIVVVSNTIGVLLPFALNRLRLDPAVASSPLITSIADVAGLLIYFSVATRVLAL